MSLPTIVPRSTPLPPLQRVPLYALQLPPLNAGRKRPSNKGQIECLMGVQRGLTLRLEREWDDFASGRCALPWRGKTMKRWHRINVEIAVAGLKAEGRVAGEEQVRSERQRASEL